MSRGPINLDRHGIGLSHNKLSVSAISIILEFVGMVNHVAMEGESSFFVAYQSPCKGSSITTGAK